MSVIERDVVLQSKDGTGNPTIDFPVTRLGLVEDTAEIKAAPAAGDYIPVVDSANGGQMKKAPVTAFQMKIIGTVGQVVGFDSNGDAVPQDGADPAGTADLAVVQHDTSPDAHYHLRALITQAAQDAKNAQLSADAALKIITEIKNTIEVVPSQSGTLTYTGAELSPSWNSYDPNALTIGGTVKGTNAGTYTATFTPKGDHTWSDGTKTAKSVTWTIGRATITTVPTQSGSLTYTGAELTPTFSGYDSAKMTRGGTVKGTNAGSYNATFTPKANYQWSNGTTTAKSVSWSIGKAAGSLSLNKTSMSLDVSTLTGTIEVTRAGDGAITATSSNTSIATVSVSGTTVTVTAKAKGSATITIKVAAGTNHTAPSSKTCSVTANLPSTTLSDNTPEIIQQIAQAGTAPNYWSVGDKIGIAINGTVGALTLNSTYYAFILGFNHNSAVEGNNSIHFQFGKTNDGTDIAFCDAGVNNFYGDNASARFVMNSSGSNIGGWKSSRMRNTICPAFLNTLPTAWQNIIVACTKYSDNAGGYNESGNDISYRVTSTSDKIWLLSEFEVIGIREHANSAEQNYQKQYDYYKNGNSKIKYRHNATTTACGWWLRSVMSSANDFFCRFYSTGLNGSNGHANCSYGFAPGFKVA